MNSFRVARGPLGIGTGADGDYVRVLAVAAMLCVTVFLACFALGRVEQPTAPRAEKLPASLPAASAGTAIPVALGSVPPIDVVAPKPVAVRTRALGAGVTRGKATVTGSASSVAPTAAAPATPTPTTPASDAPAAKAPVASKPVSSGGGSSKGASSPAGGGSSRSGKSGAKSETSSGTPFVSSG